MVTRSKPKLSFFLFILISFVGTLLWLAVTSIFAGISFLLTFPDKQPGPIFSFGAITIFFAFPVILSACFVYIWSKGNLAKVLIYSLLVLGMLLAEDVYLHYQSVVQTENAQKRQNDLNSTSPLGAAGEFYTQYTFMYNKNHGKKDDITLRQEYAKNNPFLSEEFIQKVLNSNFDYVCKLNNIALGSPQATKADDLSNSGTNAQVLFHYGTKDPNENQIHVYLNLINGKWYITDTKCE